MEARWISPRHRCWPRVGEGEGSRAPLVDRPPRRFEHLIDLDPRSRFRMEIVGYVRGVHERLPQVPRTVIWLVRSLRSCSRNPETVVVTRLAPRESREQRHDVKIRLIATISEWAVRDLNPRPRTRHGRS